MGTGKNGARTRSCSVCGSRGRLVSYRATTQRTDLWCVCVRMTSHEARRAAKPVRERKRERKNVNAKSKMIMDNE